MHLLARRNASLFLFVFIFFGASIQRTHAQRAADQLVYHTDDYTFRASGYYWYASPSGQITKYPSDSGAFPFNASTGFHDYSTFYGEADWKFHHRHHFILTFSPNSTSNTAVLQQTVFFQGYTYLAGSPVTTKLRSIGFAPGYQFDFIRNERGHLGVFGELNFLDFYTSIAGEATLTGAQGSVTQTDSKEQFVPLPALGVEGKLFLSPNQRLYAEGFFKGGYYFGYGSSYGAEGDVGFRIIRPLDFKAGYLLGQRLAVHGTTNNTHIDLTQTGPIVGLQYTF